MRRLVEEIVRFPRSPSQESGSALPRNLRASSTGLYRSVALSLVVLTSIVAIANAADPAVDFQREVRPLLQQYCLDCHGAKQPKPDFRVDLLDAGLASGKDVEAWRDLLDRINLGEMPPPKAAQPTAAERTKLVKWITAGLRQAAAAERFASGRVLTRRLTRYEYQNTMSDLLGVSLNFSHDLPPEPPSAQGFLNDGAVLEMSPSQLEAYLAAARRGLAEAIVSGPRPKVYEHSASETAVGKLPNRKVQGRPAVQPEYLIDLQDFPRRGEFSIKIRVGATVPSGQGYPRLQVSLGFVPGIIHVPRKVVGEADVTASVDQPQVLEFRGRMEDFPQPGDVPFGNVDFDGMIALIDYFDADGNELRYADRTYVQPKPAPKKNVKGSPPAATDQSDSLTETTTPNTDRLDIVIHDVQFTAPVIEQWPPPSHTRILFPRGEAGDGQFTDDAAYIREVIRRFMTRAYRRPPQPAEVERTARLFDAIRPHSKSLEEAVRETLASVLVSPHFLYRVETRSQDTPSESVNDCELASRLSYFLWATMPDDTLLDLAIAGKLANPQVLQQQTERMLADERSDELWRRLADQWFDLGALDRVAVNPEYYPDFDNRLKDDMRSETRAFLAEIARSDQSVLQLLDSDWTMLNRSLAQHYGLQGPRGSAFERVELPEGDRRGGLLGQASFLLSNSNGESSHPIKRAVWILDRLLDSPPAPPPPDVPELDTQNVDLAKLTLKEQLAVHREKESCANCHRGIDPWGVPLEHFDAIGLWREVAVTPASSNKPSPRKRAKGKPRPTNTQANPANSGGAAREIDATSVLPDGTSLDGGDALKQYLLNQRRDLFARSVVKRTASYALGRSLDLGDESAVEDLTTKLIANDFRLKSLIIQLVQSELFRTK